MSDETNSTTLDPEPAIELIDSEPQLEPVVLDDRLWQELIELTDGAAAPCYQCGVCTATCPWGTVREQALSVRKMMRNAQLGLFEGNDDVWLCTGCRQCEAYCPRGVPIADVFRALRQLAWEHRQVLGGLPSVLWSVYWNNNPWDQPPSQRSQWSKDRELPSFDPDLHEYLLYVGCTASYDRRAQKVARAVVELLDAAGVSYGVLGDDEPCCGESVLSMGYRPYFDEVAGKASAVFEDRGVQKMVVISPHCFDVFVNQYDGLGKQVEIYHYTQLLAQLIEQGQLQFEAAEGLTATFHDPCLLGRGNGEYQAPRTVLSSIPAMDLVEMQHTQVDSLCCGGGGGRMWMETEPGQRFADLRVQEAVEAGASVVVTACPACIACLEDSVKSGGLKLAVMDVAELAAAKLQSTETAAQPQLER